MKHSRLHALDALRGMAAIAVVVYHYFSRYDTLFGHESLAVDWSILGKYGVQLFFIVSGFVIFWTINRVEKPIDFLFARFSRLYPVYWAAAALTYAIVAVVGLPGKEVSPAAALLNLTMLQEFLRVPHVDGVYWTLTVELVFYAWVFFFYLIKKLDWLDLFLAAAAAANVLNSFGLIALPPAVSKLVIAQHASFFLAGVCFFNLINTQRHARGLTLLLFSYIAGAAMHPASACLVFLGIYLLFYFAATNRASVLEIKPLVMLGTISYPLYLVHQNIGYAVIRRAESLGCASVLAIAIAASVTLLLATALHTLVEKPSLTWLRQAYRARRTKRDLGGIRHGVAEV